MSDDDLRARVADMSERQSTETRTRLSKLAPPHNPLLGPATCMCVPCCHVITNLRCTAVASGGERCGDYKGHRGHHTMLVATTFLIAEERIRLDGSGGQR